MKRGKNGPPRRKVLGRPAKPKRDSKGRFVRRVKPVRDSKGRFVSKGRVRATYVKEIEGLRRELERLRKEGKARDADVERNYKRRGGAYDQFVSILAIGQQVKIDKWLDEVYDGSISKEDFVTMAVATGLSVREAWAVLYS